MSSSDIPARGAAQRCVRAALCAAMLCGLLLSGCGMRGPLYLPQPEAATQPQDPERK